MKIKGINPDTGAEYEADAELVDNDFVKTMSDFKMTDDAIKKMIGNLNISADAKSLLYTFSKATIKAGEFVLKIGRKVIDCICLLFKEYPSATFGMIFGAILGFLISAIPVIGVVLGPLVTPIAMALGLVMGMHTDIGDKALARRIAEINAKFSPLNA